MGGGAGITSSMARLATGRVGDATHASLALAGLAE